jgi:hypothetical protein
VTSAAGSAGSSAGGGDFLRLSELIARQRREIDRLEAQAAARAVVDLARGVLMERLGCSPAEAQAQLEALSADSGSSVTELAAQITGQAAGPAGGGPGSAGPAGISPVGDGPGGADGGDRGGDGPGGAGSSAGDGGSDVGGVTAPAAAQTSVVMAGAAAELARDGAGGGAGPGRRDRGGAVAGRARRRP